MSVARYPLHGIPDVFSEFLVNLVRKTIARLPERVERVVKHSTASYTRSLLAKTLSNKMSQLQIFREDKQRVMSLTLSRLFAGKTTTRRRQGGDACSAIGCSNARNKYSYLRKNFFFGFRRMKQGKKFKFMK